MTETAILITIVSSLLSGIIGVLLSFYFFNRLEKRKLKVDTARRLIGSRYDIKSSEFQVTFNEVLIVFSDNKEIMSAIEDFWNILQSKSNYKSDDIINDKLVIVLKLVCEEVGMVPKNLNETYFLRIFTTDK